METRTANLIIGTSGGTAGGNAINYKLALPSTWIKDMGLTPGQRQVELRFGTPSAPGLPLTKPRKRYALKISLRIV